jgi:hypothetical protein
MLGRPACRSTPGLPAALGLRQQVRGRAAQAAPERQSPAALCDRSGTGCRSWTASAVGAFRQWGGKIGKLRWAYPATLITTGYK